LLDQRDTRSESYNGAPVVTIKEVVHAAPGAAVPRVHLDSPKPGAGGSSYAIAFEGWVMGAQSPPVRLEIYRPHLLLGQVPIGTVPRPDLKRIYPDIPWAVSHSGFYASIGAFRLPREFEFHVDVVHADDTRTYIATVRGERRLAPMSSAGVQPLVVTTLGRSGSHWVIDLLSRHREIVAYPPYRTEVRVASYWADVFLALSEPASYRQAIEGVVPEAEDGWWLGQGRRMDQRVDDEGLVKWVGREQAELVMRLCRANVTAFYERLADAEGSAPAYFIEKRLPSVRRVMLTMQEMFPGAREIILVRDFRDVLCSILAYNKQLGGAFFNRALASSDEDYVRDHLGPSIQMLLDVWRERSSTAFLLRYEDLVFKPRETLASLLSYLDLDEVDEDLAAMLDESPRYASAAQTQHRTVASARESVGRWRRDLCPELIGPCEETFGQALRQFGYIAGSGA
jgi:hypothetical protein